MKLKFFFKQLFLPMICKGVMSVYFVLNNDCVTPRVIAWEKTWMAQYTQGSWAWPSQWNIIDFFNLEVYLMLGWVPLTFIYLLSLDYFIWMKLLKGSLKIFAKNYFGAIVINVKSLNVFQNSYSYQLFYQLLYHWTNDLVLPHTIFLSYIDNQTRV